MNVTLCAVGRLRPGPELTLFNAYRARFDRTGRSLGLGPLNVAEVEARKGGGQAEEARLLARAVPEGAVKLGLDERGRLMTSPEFAALLARWRDDGRGTVAVMIGGADGLTDDARGQCDRLVSFGPMVWPHMLVRVMIAEQLYRAASILANAPYHRA
jgi:23S rRNA (pseudouridine1915-N3)-methyltransferase